MNVAGLFFFLFATATFSPYWHGDMNSRLRNDQEQIDEKESRSPAQKKIDSQLLYAIYQMRGEAKAKGIPTEAIVLRRDQKNRVLVDIRSEVTRKLTSVLKKCGSNVLSTSPKDHSVIAYVPLKHIEKMAELKEVRFISQPSEAITN